MATKYRVRNKRTGSYVTKAVNSVKAFECYKKLCSLDPQGYELISITEQIEKLPPELRDMTELELKAIEVLKLISYNPGSGHADFANTLIEKAEGEKRITERQSLYLWHLIYNYRRQVNDQALINEAKMRKIY
ncbi:MAG: hypothetical protein PHX51_07060 [Clostridia bacterium]|nr:hypothetical protein [Clostridia bacterium]